MASRSTSVSTRASTWSSCGRTRWRPVEDLGFTELRPFDETETELASAETPPAEVPNTGSIPMLTYDVLLHDATFLAQTSQEIKALGLQIAGAKGRKIRYYVLATDAADQEQNVRALEGVRKAEQYIEPQLHNDVARVLLGIDPAANPGAGMIETGAGQVVGVADTGLDQTHPDFQGRIVGVSALGRVNDATDPHGHGTHVAGSVLGSGAASAQKYRGAAPAARLFFQSLLDSKGGLGGLPLDLNDLFDEAYQKNARIHNNSWGSAVGAEYTLNSQEVDEFVAKKRDMLIVISAGNEGQAAMRVNSKKRHGRLVVDRRAGLVQERADRRRVAIEPHGGRLLDDHLRRRVAWIVSRRSDRDRNRFRIAGCDRGVQQPRPLHRSARQAGRGGARHRHPLGEIETRLAAEILGTRSSARSTPTWAARAWRRRSSPAAPRWCANTSSPSAVMPSRARPCSRRR